MAHEGEAPMDLRIRMATVDDIVPLRHAVLRLGLPREEAIFAGDADPSARHAAAWIGKDVVGCATFHRSIWEDQPAWQLRGMAVSTELRGKGVGQAVLAFLEERVMAESPIRLFWCNARTPAAGFYRRLGWRIVSDIFEIPTAGPHYRMVKVVEPSA
jgi:GNAT superfamily N-acetyltransferase